VVLVGRTGLDEAARAATGAEVLRAPTLLDAVAEAGIALGPDSPRACIVLVADDAIEQGERVVGSTAVQDFVHAVKRVSPGARVYRVGNVVDGGFDGNVPSRAETGVIERLMDGGQAAVGDSARGRQVAEVEQREIEDLMAVMLDDVSAGEHAPVVASVPSASAVHGAMSARPVTPADVGAHASGVRSVWTDETLAQRAAKGHALWSEVERLLRARCGDAQLRLMRVEEGCPAGCRGVDVVLAERVLARMVIEGGHAATLERAFGLVHWAASWLALDEQMRTLREAAFKDPLTGAWNRRYFEKFLPAAIERARLAKRFVTLLLFDIDDFKRWNDRYGHIAGDEVLRETVKLMESAVRPTDRVCRVGGDEFAVIFYEPEGPREVGSKHPEDVTGIAARFEALIRAKRFPKLGGDAPGRLGVSGGLATYPWDGRDMHELLRVADERAMGCKRNGKNAIVFGDQSGELP
jgi:diguanylate cyclase (GGDEF)-like protein